MDLTQLTHTLTISGTTHTIDEPVNFDSMRLTMKRNADYHGISIETTEATLRFYDSNLHSAATLIATAYETDIDSDITYTVTDASTAAIVYQGKLDLSTYTEKQGAYFAVECKVGEIGIKTTFNNRTETEVDILSTKTMNGITLAHVAPWKVVNIPPLTIQYTNQINTDETFTITPSDTVRFRLPADRKYHFIALELAKKTTLSEFGQDFNVGFADIADYLPAAMDDLRIGDYYEPFFDKGDYREFGKKYGPDSTYSLKADINISIGFESAPFPTQELPKIYTGKYSAQLVIVDPDSTFANPVKEAAGIPVTLTNSAQGTQTAMHLGSSTIGGIIQKDLILGILLTNNTTYHTSADPTELPWVRNYATDVTVTVFSGSYLKMTLNSSIRNEITKTEVLPVHEALNTIAEMISENALTVKSDYYGRFDSNANPITGTNTFGPGSLKSITSGYRLRNGYPQTARDSIKQLPLSFRELIESLNSIDCIGWGFTTENGATCLRVEKWDYFYQNETILTINDPNELTKTIDTDRIITELIIGYKKYTTKDEINSILSIHSEQTYNNNCLAINRRKSCLCSFIADIYAIEEARRKQLQQDTAEFKYDDNIFVIELAAAEHSQGILYLIPQYCISQASGMSINTNELYNMRITPHRNALRWINYLAMENHPAFFNCTNTKQNAEAVFNNTPSAIFPQPVHFHEVDILYREREVWPLIYNPTNIIAKKEIVSITYPLTLAQYQALKQNPYGLINVDGKDYWLQEATYEFKTGKTDLKLIPKTNN